MYAANGQKLPLAKWWYRVVQEYVHPNTFYRLMHDGGWWCGSGVGGAGFLSTTFKTQQPPLQKKMPLRNVQIYSGILELLIGFCSTKQYFHERLGALEV